MRTLLAYFDAGRHLKKTVKALELQVALRLNAIVE